MGRRREERAEGEREAGKSAAAVDKEPPTDRLGEPARIARGGERCLRWRPPARRRIAIAACRVHWRRRRQRLRLREEKPDQNAE